MSWTAPRTWVASETVTAALLNTHVRDNEIDLDSRFLGGQWQQTTLQAIPATTATTLTNWTADFANAAFNTTTGVYTCPVAGTYEAWGIVSLVAGATRNGALLALNGTVVTQSNTGSGVSVLSPSIPPFRMTCALNDTIVLQAYVQSGVNTSVAAGSKSLFCVRRIG